MAAGHDELRDEIDAAARFMLAGLLDSATVSMDDALAGEKRRPWLPGHSWARRKVGADLGLGRFQARVSQTAAWSPFPGGRLEVHLSAQRGADDVGLVRQVVRDAGYQAAGRLEAVKTGLAALSFGPVRSPGLGADSAFDWPLQICGNESTLEALYPSRAVRRGYAALFARPPGYARSVFAQLADFGEEGLGQRVLTLRFAGYDEQLRPLRQPVTLDQLDWTGTTVLFPLERSSPAERLTDFVFGLAYDLTLDVAAWQATQLRGERAPIVIAPGLVLDRSRLAESVPAFGSRLGWLPRHMEIPLGRDDRASLRAAFGGRELETPVRPARLRNLLHRASETPFPRRSLDAADGLAAVGQAIRALRRDLDRPPPVVRGGGGGGLAKPVVYESEPPLAIHEWAPATEALKPRYTDVVLSDSHGHRLDFADAPIREHHYALDVAIRTERRGLTRDREDQRQLCIPKQPAIANVWVVIADESEPVGEAGPVGFTFSRQFAPIQVPVTGDSLDSARFVIVPRLAGDKAKIGRIGIRLYHKLILIDHLQLQLRIVPAWQERPRRDPPAIAVALKTPSGDEGIEALDLQSRARALTISISRAEGEGNYLFSFLRGSGEEGVPAIAGTRKLPESELNNYLAEFRDILLDLAFGPALAKTDLPPQQGETFLRRIAALGSKIVVSLFNYQQRDDFYRLGTMVQEALGELPIVQVALSEDAQDFVFPWQILSVEPRPSGAPPDPDNLWGYRFVVEVKRCGDGLSSPPQPHPPWIDARIHYARWNFANEGQHRANLKSMAKAASASGRAARIVEPPIDTEADFVAALNGGGGDLFYIYAHGSSAAPATPSGHKLFDAVLGRMEALQKRLEANVLGLAMDEIEEARRFHSLLAQSLGKRSATTLMLTHSTITLTDLTLAMDSLADAPIVFVNTCESAQIWNDIPSSFVGLFLDRGARAVVGTEATVPVAAADPFGRCVLERLFAGQPVGEAVRGSRRELLARYNNPLGLAYTVYGAADAGLFDQTGMPAT
jgi:hypothetical protein